MPAAASSQAVIGLRWHVFYTGARQEKLAGASIADLGFQVFIPWEKRIRRLPRAKPKILESALFPRYGFVRFTTCDCNWAEILEADGVMDILRSNQIPVPVNAAAINALQLAANVGIFDKTRPPKIGMEVEVTDGPFHGWIGKILRARTGDRMDVLLKMFGAECKTTIPLVALKEITL